jgi:hypothetical protein
VGLSSGKAVKALRKAVKHHDEEVRREAEEALRQLPGEPGEGNSLGG